jgi:hypothetical protein
VLQIVYVDVVEVAIRAGERIQFDHETRWPIGSMGIVAGIAVTTYQREFGFGRRVPSVNED